MHVYSLPVLVARCWPSGLIGSTGARREQVWTWSDGSKREQDERAQGKDLLVHFVSAVHYDVGLAGSFQATISLEANPGNLSSGAGERRNTVGARSAFGPLPPVA